MPGNLEIRQQMFEIIERWHQSGLSQKCRLPLNSATRN